MSKQPATIDRIEKSLAKRYRAEKRFKWYGRISIIFALSCLGLLFTDIISKGHGAFEVSYIELDVNFDSEVLGVYSLDDEEAMALGDWEGIIKQALRNEFSEVTGRKAKRELYSLASTGAGYDMRDHLLEQPELFNSTAKLWVVADDDLDSYYKSALDGEPYVGRISENQRQWIDSLIETGKVELRFNSNFFTNGDSREPEQAGILSAIVGSILTMIVTLGLSFPVGVAAAIYLEEFAPKNKWTDFIEVNINNLAAVPSIIFGLLGLAIFISFFEVPRSIPLIGGLVLTLMTLPTIIITSRAAIKTVPPSIRDAARGLGASKQQVVLHHVLPLAMPGMLTGAIIGMAQALGETAPLMMIGMIAFIVDVPAGFTDPSTVLPVQIFLWADSPERAFVEKTSAAIMVLLGFLVCMNTFAVVVRKRLEKRW
ncbi:MAG: phosphate transport system permease protein [Chitinophagales bacterium]|jgi:phosphate transport system permease protein